MRIVIDMQGAQTESRYRGIGRYTVAFAEALVRHRGDHEVVLALSGLFPETVQPLRDQFGKMLPRENIRLWHAPTPVMARVAGNESRQEMAEVLREDFLKSLRPDIVHVFSLFEGFVDDAVASVRIHDKDTPVSVTLHDLIPLRNPEHFLHNDKAYAAHYYRRLRMLQQADLYLANSRFTARDAVRELGLPVEKVIPVLGGVGPEFHPLDMGSGDKADLMRRLGITRPFVFYVGGCDEHKNLKRLIAAFAALPKILRLKYQLVFAGHMPDGNVALLTAEARSSGLAPGELHFVGHVSNDDLVKLYSTCKLFVFPSWHEGLGMPPLEAMACGAVVLASSVTSLPEVVGREETMFNPFDVKEISAKMLKALTDNEFRASLKRFGPLQASKFTWEACAKKSLAAFEDLHRSRIGKSVRKRAATSLGERTIKVAADMIGKAGSAASLARIVARNRSAGDERQLLVDVSEISQKDAGSGVQRVVRSHLLNLLDDPPKGFRVEPVYATRRESYRYAHAFARRFHGLSARESVDGPVDWQRGDIFFALDMQHHVQLANRDFYAKLRADGVTVKFLVHDLLPIQLEGLFRDPDAKQLHEQWLAMVARADAAICVSKATASALEFWIEQGAFPTSENFTIEVVHSGADFFSPVPSATLTAGEEQTLKLLNDRPTFLCVSTVEPRKKQDQIIDAFEILWSSGVDVNLVFVGRAGWQIEALEKKLRSHPESNRRFFWLEGIEDGYLERVYGSSVCTIAASLNEGFGLSLVESASRGVPLLVRDLPVFREIAGDGAFYFNGEDATQMADALRHWLKLYSRGEHPKAEAVRFVDWKASTENLKHALVGKNYPRQQIFVDISELVRKDAGSGIQRVVRNVLAQWLSNPPEGFRIEPVHAGETGPYMYSRKFTASFMGADAPTLPDDPIDFAPGDVFFALDMQPQVQVAHREFYRELRRSGVRTCFLVHDLLPVQMPEHFPEGNEEGFVEWLKVVAECDSAICVSKSSGADLQHWLDNNRNLSPECNPVIELSWCHNGADLEKNATDSRAVARNESLIAALDMRHTFLMVGTVEPRKSHRQVLDAFEQLWSSGADINLVIVGKKGWLSDDLFQRLEDHAEYGKKIFWMQEADDSFLEHLYSRSSCLLAASYGEGFGLPLIEAARRKLPILARDIPVFREVAGCHAAYFDADGPSILAEAIAGWLEDFRAGKHRTSERMPYSTWEQAANNLLRLVLERNCPDGQSNYSGEMDGEVVQAAVEFAS